MRQTSTQPLEKLNADCLVRLQPQEACLLLCKQLPHHQRTGHLRFGKHWPWATVNYENKGEETLLWDSGEAGKDQGGPGKQGPLDKGERIRVGRRRPARARGFPKALSQEWNPGPTTALLPVLLFSGKLCLELTRGGACWRRHREGWRD